MEEYDLPLSSVPKKKRKISEWISSSFSSNVVSKKPHQQRKWKYSRHSSSEFSVNDPNQTWLERYAPTVVDDLAVHKKKISDVEIWITQHLSPHKDGAPILLLTGPPGCGKSTTLTLVAKKHGLQLEEWTNPLTTPYTVTKEAGLKYESQNTQFDEFLFRSGKYPSLLLNKQNDVGTSHKLIMLEELPNFMYQDPPVLKEILRKYHRTQKWPLVLILSDGASSATLKRHLADMKSQITTISFNSISSTLMTKALNLICKAENRVIAKEDLLILSSLGDIRYAINNLQFSSCRQSDKFGGLQNEVSKSCKTKTDKPCLGGKDSTLILFRALGKIFYCKRDKTSEPYKVFEEHHRDPLLVQPEVVLDQCCLSGNAFSLFLHQNYLLFFDGNPVNDIATASDYLSLSDLMNSPGISCDPSSGAATSLDFYEGILAARGLVYSNSFRATSELCSKVTGAWRPMHKPAWYQVKRQEQENRINSHCLFWKQQDTIPYLKYHSERFNPEQKFFIRDVINLPQWKAFRSNQGEKLSEEEIGAELPEVSETTETKYEIKEDDMEVDDADFIIEEFSD
ncbi:cell cycle checkpoint protein RAD17-like [Clavelina lepadiformis]|uniref:cell cycle checkpoint protein RAD17-like n=1 Tax=Clavelina lepadiformis TaxID=159417 RepID=UPI0040436DD8